ncbi:head completion/stabilization protein [Cupriavidus sp. D384]|uniref:head completion/stabilization protein n=1 Tax=Cupriavidus sp. D384 TaxID=1538095 RepID=UPI00082FD9F9|nr:head completion/stabilization protein [Cupriavidus sp. D384]
MSSFLANAPAQPGQTVIANDGFFPAIDVSVAMAAMRQDGTVSAERLRAALIEAILSVNEDLAAWRGAQQAAGHARLEDVPAKIEGTIDGKPAHVHRYLRAVYCEARAGLIERYRDYDATAAGDRKAEALMQAVDDLRRDARWSVSDIVGRPRSTVELI